MKVAFCIRPDYAVKVGGDTIQFINTKENLEQQFNIQVNIITEPYRLDDTYDIIHVFNMITVAETKAFLIKAREFPRAKLVLSTIFWNYEYIAIKDIARFFNYAIPSTELHTKISRLIVKLLAMLTNKPRIIARPFKNFCRECLNSAHLLMPNSIEELHELSKFTGLDFNKLKEKTQVVVNATKFTQAGADDDNFLKQYNLPSGFVLLVGRIELTKNQLNVVRALFNHPEIPIVFIGRSNDDKYVKKLKSLAAKRGNVYFINEVPNDKIYLFYRKAALHILPSFRESPGLVSLEALSQQCKIVVADSRFTPVETYFKSNATVINPSSVASIRKGIMHELSAQRNMQEIQNEIIEQFTWANAAKATYEGYRKILG